MCFPISSILSSSQRNEGRKVEGDQCHRTMEGTEQRPIQNYMLYKLQICLTYTIDFILNKKTFLFNSIKVF